MGIEDQRPSDDPCRRITIHARHKVCRPEDNSVDPHQKAPTSDITRFHPGPRYCEATVHNGTAYLAGQVADDGSQDIRGQTAQVLAAIDRLLAEVGSDRSRILMAQIYLADLADYDGMNAVWDTWVPHGHAPPRATVQSRLARPEWRIEIVVTAAVMAA